MVYTSKKKSLFICNHTQYRYDVSVKTCCLIKCISNERKRENEIPSHVYVFVLPLDNDRWKRQMPTVVSYRYIGICRP